MVEKSKNILSLIEFITVNKAYVVCHFKCGTKNRVVTSTVPLEPYNSNVDLSWRDILLHPIDSYEKYYHRPITIYSHDCYETLVCKAFEKVSNNFFWDNEEEKYICS